MCNEKTSKNEFYLDNKIQIDGPLSDFNLIVDNNLILEHCSNFSLIANVFFATKSNSKIHVFAAKAIQIDGKSCLDELAVINTQSPYGFAKININENIYVIDYDCKITFKYEQKFTKKI